MWSVIKKNVIEFVMFVVISLIFEALGFKNWMSLLLSVLSSIIIKKAFEHYKGKDPDLDERLRFNAEKAGLATLSYLVVLLGIAYFYLVFTSHNQANLLLQGILLIAASFMCFLTIYMRKN